MRKSRWMLGMIPSGNHFRTLKPAAVVKKDGFGIEQGLARSPIAADVRSKAVARCSPKAQPDDRSRSIGFPQAPFPPLSPGPQRARRSVLLVGVGATRYCRARSSNEKIRFWKVRGYRAGWGIGRQTLMSAVKNRLRRSKPTKPEIRLNSVIFRTVSVRFC